MTCKGKKPEDNPPKIIVDTKEKKPWVFEGESIRRGLPTGDYTLEGYEDQFVIERKGTPGELIKNLTQARFTKELERLESFKMAFIVCEFTMADIIAFPLNSGIHPSRWRKLRVTASFFLKRFIEIQIRYKTKVILAGPCGKDFALSSFKRAVERLTPKVNEEKTQEI